MMESIERLRKMDDGMLVPLGNGQYVPDHSHNDIADQIEAEIAERYMELPTDADGVPIHVGDLIEYGFKGERLEVTHIGLTKHGEPTIAYRRPNGTLDCSCIGGECRHVKPHTVEDMLRMLIGDYENTANGPFDIDFAPTIKRYADKIVGLLGVSE